MSALSVTNRSIAPAVPAGTMAAFAVTTPVGAFNVETTGCCWPVGYTVRYPSGAAGIAVKFNEYAMAVAGMLQELDWIGKLRDCWLIREGPPRAPGVPRVSTTRHGGRG